MIYRIAFSSPDHHATLAAARAGAGLMVLPADVPLSGLVNAKEYYLPQLRPVKLVLCATIDGAAKRPDFFEAIAGSFFPNADCESKKLGLPTRSRAMSLTTA